MVFNIGTGIPKNSEVPGSDLLSVKPGAMKTVNHFGVSVVREAAPSLHQSTASPSDHAQPQCH